MAHRLDGVAVRVPVVDGIAHRPEQYPRSGLIDPLDPGGQAERQFYNEPSLVVRLPETWSSRIRMN